MRLTCFKKLILLIVIFFYTFSFYVNAKEIPIIVISAGKTAQNKNTIGSDVSIISKEEIENSSSIFLGELLGENLNSINFSQSGGYGTNSLIQLRGLPKRYTNVYIDGIKMSDPSSPDNAFYFNNLTLNGVDKIEVLKGPQSSLYGSSAIAGTVNISTKKGEIGNHQKLNLIRSSNNTNNLNLSFNGMNSIENYFFGINSFATDGISAMSDNNEKDKYKNNNIVASYGYKINELYKIENNLFFTKSKLEYDEVNFSRPDNNKTIDQDFLYSFKILMNNNLDFNNTLTYSKKKIKRKILDFNQENQERYNGDRDSINILTEYNANLDTKIIFGLDNEFDGANYKTWNTSGYKKTSVDNYGQYLDLHTRLFEKFYTTVGLRNDKHSIAGSYKTYRATAAYKLNYDTKFRSSMGTGIRFPSLNDYFYDQNISDLNNLKPEKSRSFDIGIEQNINNYLNYNFSLFYNEYKDNISGWQTNNDNGNNPFGYTIQNSSGRTTSKGTEFSVNYNPKKKINFNLNYTFTKAYDGEDCDDPSRNCDISSYPVRVPKHLINFKISKQHSNYFYTDFSIKYVSKVRDYGNINNAFQDVLLNSYYLSNLNLKYKTTKNDLFFIKIENIFNKNYEQAYQYSSFGRQLAIGIKKQF